jgi:DNA-binding transcriptional ArsR family regulator
MPTLTSELVRTPEKTKIRLAEEPAVNTLGTLIYLCWVDKYSGLDPWIVNTAESLPEALRHRNLVVIQGLFYAWTPEQHWGSFPEYVDHLDTIDPIVLRDRVLDTYIHLPCQIDEDRQDTMTKERLLSNFETFIEYLKGKFKAEAIDLDVERESFRLLSSPGEMKSTIVDHFRVMWEEYLSKEWDRVLPRIEDSLTAFREVDFSEMDDKSAIRFITDQPDDRWDWLVEQANEVILIPSAHSGPYSYGFLGKKIGWILFGARIPQGAFTGSADLSRAELLVRLSALADESRLKILSIVQDQSEVCAQQFIDMLGLSQSSCSRHLRQLTATGYLLERRTEAGKCYSMNHDRIKDTAKGLEAMFAKNGIQAVDEVSTEYM